MMPSYTMDGALKWTGMRRMGALRTAGGGYYQIVAGRRKSFRELQEDDDGYLAVMIHSGSRHFGKSVCDYFHYKARQLNQKWFSAVPDEYRLAFLPVDTREQTIP